jgi:hypothetical protein
MDNLIQLGILGGLIACGAFAGAVWETLQLRRH